MNASTTLIHSLRQFLDLAMHRSMRERARFLKSTGLSFPQFGILMYLHHRGGCGITDISEDFDVTAPAASQMAEKLVRAGLVARGEDPNDRRARHLTLTSEGRALIDKGGAERYHWLGALVAGLRPAERESVARAMRLLLAAAGSLDEPKENEQEAKVKVGSRP